MTIETAIKVLSTLRILLLIYIFSTLIGRRKKLKSIKMALMTKYCLTDKEALYIMNSLCVKNVLNYHEKIIMLSSSDNIAKIMCDLYKETAVQNNELLLKEYFHQVRITLVNEFELSLEDAIAAIKKSQLESTYLAKPDSVPLFIHDSVDKTAKTIYESWIKEKVDE